MAKATNWRKLAIARRKHVIEQRRRVDELLDEIATVRREFAHLIAQHEAANRSLVEWIDQLVTVDGKVNENAQKPLSGSRPILNAIKRVAAAQDREAHEAINVALAANADLEQALRAAKARV